MIRKDLATESVTNMTAINQKNISHTDASVCELGSMNILFIYVYVV